MSTLCTQSHYMGREEELGGSFLRIFNCNFLIVYYFSFQMQICRNENRGAECQSGQKMDEAVEKSNEGFPEEDEVKFIVRNLFQAVIGDFKGKKANEM